MKYLFTVLATVLQSSFGIAINTECHPNINKDIKCLHNKATSTSESGEKLSFRNLKVPRSYLERTNISSSEEDASVINSYEGIRKVSGKLNNSKTKDKVKSVNLRNFDDQDDEIYDESVKFESSENQRDISLAVDISENEDVSYKKPENFHNFPDSTDISHGESEYEGFEHIRKSHKENPDSIKYNSYESIKNHLEKDKWSLIPTRQSNVEKRILPALLWIIGTNVISYGIGELIKAG